MFDTLPSLLGLILVPLPFFIAALLTKGGIGGGDIKLAGAIGFALGTAGGLAAMLIGLITSMIAWRFMAKNKRINHEIPLVPFMTLGVFIVFIYIKN